MKAKEYNFKYNYLYPLLGVLLYFILSLMFFYLIEVKFEFMQLNNTLYLLFFIFLIEAILHANAAQELKIPALTFILEFAVYLFAIIIFSGRYQGLDSILTLNNLDLFLFWGFSIFIWYQTAELCRLLEYFRKDFDKIYDRSSENWNLEEFRRLLDYPVIWPRLTQKISWLNLSLFIIWAAVGEMNSTIIVLTILFLVIEVFLLALTYLDKKTVDWRVNRIKEPAAIKSGWRKFLLFFIISALLLAFLLPANYQPLPMDRINSFLAQRLALTEMPEINPEANLPENSNSGKVPSAVEDEESLLIEILFIIIQVALTLFLGFILLALILFLIKSELSKIKNLPQFFKSFYTFLIKALKDIFASVKEMNFNLSSSWKKRREKKKNKKLNKKEVKDIKNIDLSGESNSIIIRIYNSLLKLLSLKGIGKDPAATPYEYSSYLQDKYQDLKEEINNLTDIFVESAYSNHSLGENAVKAAKSIWKILKKKI
ncbi:hypothetical protein DFR79_102227 [Halanaerobium saccharolyticum]|uniref:Protein-glutamine gamma-glutamyltransferase-like C-terminal domain-containing protein n=1 Tax=Halanaerobium saccharolyticum TaxID=43595 RepID=A0A4R6M0W9_9FIRM|nr:DUF4129 domain-containing protein [Halanaerobium saccharolyticum]TDO94848.1 hypothetical protein DFR79_102227 [Halanaerobium saccharolyticum]